MKTCKYCNTTKSLTDFNFTNKLKGYTKPYCKTCESELNKKSYLQNRDSRLESSKAWQEANVEKYLEYQKKYNEQRKTKQSG